ncbi:EAL domain-containing protein [Glaciecola siphonariae]|uniref:EAL domain-containing protein n=1 Tax=Glaciecola siphonariae TaxID=521012 RepID=A0ABV9LUJ2_9ALTE
MKCNVQGSALSFRRLSDYFDSIIDTETLQRVTNLQNRRHADDIREAINAIQDLLFDPNASGSVFTLMLEYIASISKSDYAAVFTSNAAASAPIQAHSPLYSTYKIGSRKFVNDGCLVTWVNVANSLTRPIFYNAPYSTGSASLIKADISTSAIMVLPVLIHQQLRAIFVMAKKQGKFSGADLNHLRPLLGAITCIIQSAETVTGSFVGLDHKIADTRYLSSLFASSPVGILVVDEHHNIILSNPSAFDMFRGKTDLYDEGIALKNVGIHSLIPEYANLFKWSKQQAMYGAEAHAQSPHVWKNIKANRLDDTECLIELTVFRYLHDNQRYTTLQIQDITEFVAAAEQHKQDSQQLEALTQLLPVAILKVDEKWNCAFANEKWAEFTGVRLKDVDGPSWINSIHMEDIKELLESLENSLKNVTDHHQQLRLVNPLTGIKWFDFNSRVLVDSNDQVEGFLATFSDVTESHLIQEKLRQVAEYDVLTGLANRMLLQDRLQQAFYISERENSIVSLFFLDIDGFKDVNDSLGHDVGDVLLQKISERLTNLLRRNDTVARFGGDEFVILLGKDEHITEIVTVAEKIIQHIAEPYRIGEHEIFVTTSLGIAQGRFENSDPDTLLKNADSALYSAKREGKNNFQIFDETLALGTEKRLNILTLLRADKSNSQYALYYQPICHIENKRVVGFEALVRFYDDNGCLIFPDEFIPILEETGMIIDVGRWVINECCCQLAQWQADGCFPQDGYIAFNVSAKELLQAGFLQGIKDCCQTHGVNPRHLVMEITESVIIDKPEKVKLILNDVREFGIKLALDDFGTGYSSLSYLQNYPFDILKIDKSFIDDLSENSKDTKITKAIVALASSMDLKVSAEGVETTFAYETIKSLGADIFQGYLVSKPIDASKAEQLLGESSVSQTDKK